MLPHSANDAVASGALPNRVIHPPVHGTIHRAAFAGGSIQDNVVKIDNLVSILNHLKASSRMEAQANESIH